MKPILKYPGAKWRLAPWILAYMPPHESYLEPYFGSGAVLFNKEPSRIETINDMDGAVVHFFKVCREKPAQLAEALSLTPWARDEYDDSDFHGDDMDDIERARQFAVRSWMSFGACMSKKTGWRHTTAKKKDGGPDNPKLWARLPDQVQEVARRLMMVQIENCPALSVIRAYRGSNVLIYADPPYITSTRTAHRDQYRHEMTDEDHHELLEVLRDHPGPVLLSGYDNSLYNLMLHNWRKVTHRTQAERGAVRNEVLWIKD